ncbi:hypothetical protein [Achromobacter xylosoxidans]|uniref:hypothetical protein n=1 Tax=Alcaligenes xylosoxydans xylosoxydans TaxID=85698 RepID=UPI002A74CA9F|nr:hypothetical protein [Achromobacter xylosoxidans]WPQ34349.1 hypothetical protein SLH34_27665 [Achromobacter xylosoxidans]
MTTLAKNDDENDADFEEVTKFLAEKTVSECPACGTKNWDVFGFDQSKDAYFPVVFSINGSEANKKYTRLILAECTNCGLLRQHSFRAFERWRGLRRKDSDELAKSHTENGKIKVSDE